MIRLAIVEDDVNYQRELLRYLHRYEKEHNESLQISVFSDGLDIVEANLEVIDIILMDIQMKNMDGMKAAERIRLKDKKVIIIFITNVAQFAVHGYKVEALDYVLKPVQYFAFSQTLGKAIKKVANDKAFYIHFIQENSMERINTELITYMEIQDHNVIIHTKEKNITIRENIA